MGNDIGSVLSALLTGAAGGFVEAEQEDKLKQEAEKTAVKQRRFDMAKLIFADDSATPEAKHLSLQIIGGASGKAVANFDQFVAIGTMNVPDPGSDAGSALPRGRPVALQGPPDQLNQEGNINPNAQAGITEGDPAAAALEKGLAQQPPSDFQKLEQPPTGPTQEALDRQVITEPGTKKVSIFKTEIEQIEERFRTGERVREMTIERNLQEASQFLQGLPDAVRLADKQSYFQLVRNGADPLEAAAAMNLPITEAQKKAFIAQAKESSTNEATQFFIADPSITFDDFRKQPFAAQLGETELKSQFNQLKQAEKIRVDTTEKNRLLREKTQAEIDALKASAEGTKPLTPANVRLAEKDLKQNRNRLNSLSNGLRASAGTDLIAVGDVTDIQLIPRADVESEIAETEKNINALEEILREKRTEFTDPRDEIANIGQQKELIDLTGTPAAQLEQMLQELLQEDQTDPVVQIGLASIRAEQRKIFQGK